MKSCKEPGGWRRRKSAVRTNFPAPPPSPPPQVLHQPLKVAVRASRCCPCLVEYEEVVLKSRLPTSPPPRVLRQPLNVAGWRRRKSAVRTNFPAPPPSPPPQVLHQPLEVAPDKASRYPCLVEYEDVILKPRLPPSPPPSPVSSIGSNDYPCSPCTSRVRYSPMRSSSSVNFFPLSPMIPSPIHSAGSPYDYSPASSPEYTPASSPEYSPLTLEYSPRTPEYSPFDYTPSSLEYSPLTPEYSPRTPEYSPYDYTSSSPIHWY